MTRYAVMAQRGEVSAQSSWYGTVAHTFDPSSYPKLVQNHFRRHNNGSFRLDETRILNSEGRCVLEYSLVPCKDEV